MQAGHGVGVGQLVGVITMLSIRTSPEGGKPPTGNAIVPTRHFNLMLCPLAVAGSLIVDVMYEAEFPENPLQAMRPVSGLPPTQQPMVSV